MYTVVRFDFSESAVSFDAVSERLRELTTLHVDGPDKGVPRRVSCTIQRGDGWSIHLASIGRFLRQSSAIAEWAKITGVRVSFDVAIEPDDYEGLVGSFYLEHALLMQLGSMNIDLVMSVYR